MSPRSTALRAQAAAWRALADALLLEAAAIDAAVPSAAWLTLQKAGQIFSVRSHVLRDAGKRGELPVFKAGKRSVVRPADVEIWILSRPAAPGPGLAKTGAAANDGGDPRAEARAAISVAAGRAAR